MQALAALEAVQAPPGSSSADPELFLGITEPARPGRKNGLRTLFEAHGIPLLDHHTGIGGRYSALTNVGLLPAMARGLDVRALAGRRGRGRVGYAGPLRRRDFPPAVGAAVDIALAQERGIRIR